MNDQASTVLLIPGLYNSGPDHWQTLWQKEFGFARLEQKDWDTPRCEDWAAALEERVAAEGEKVVLVAHSLACTLVAQWAMQSSLTGKVASAMLVAPSDAERPDFPAGTTGFTPIPMRRLPFHSIVAASGNDPYTPFWRATDFADAWGSELIDAGDCGHITTVDGFGPWPAGLQWLKELRG
jgi:predicted alpha/beta hydrolase family esterase